MGVWDKTTPAGSDPKSQGDDRIRELKAAMEEALQGGAASGDEAIFPGSTPSTAPVFRYRGLKGTTGSLPASGQYGMYFDTDRGVLQRDNGATWDDIGTVIPAGTVMPFFQAAAPVGWTQVTDFGDRVLRVVSGAGGGSGGTIGVSTGLAHTHTVVSHTHTFSVVSGPPSALVQNSLGDTGVQPTTTHTHTVAGTTDAATPATDSQLGILAYVDMVLASKD